MSIHRIFHSIRYFLPFLLLGLAACGTVKPHPVITGTPFPTSTVTRPGPSQVTPSPFPTGNATETPENHLPVIAAENLNQLGPLSQWQQGETRSAYAWTPDSRALLVSSHEASRNQLILLNANTHAEIWSTDEDGDFVLSNDGRWIAEVSGNDIRILDATNGVLVNGISVDACMNFGASLVRFSPDDRQLAATDGTDIYLFDRLNPVCHQPFKQVKIESLEGFVKDLIFSPDGKSLLALANGQLIFWNISDGAEIKRLTGSYAASDPGGRWLVVGGPDGVSLYDWSTLQLVRTIPEYYGRSISFSPGGRLLAAASEDGTSERLNFYNVETGEYLATYRDLPFGAYSIAFRPDGRQILIQGWNPGASDQALFLTLGVPSQPFASASVGGEATPTPWYRPRPLVLATQSPPLFPLLSVPLLSQLTTPTPINTPVAKEPLYRLKAWSESDGISLISRMVEYAHAGDVYGPSSSRPGFKILQTPIRTAALEYLLRFPHSVHANSVRWRLALANAIAGRSDSDGWIAGQIEQGLNDGVIDPKDITSSLSPYGFLVNTRLCPVDAECSWADNYAAATPIIVPDLFGDGGKTQIIQIKTVEEVTGSLLAAMHQDPAGRFFVVPVYSGWNAPYTEQLQVAVQDLTGDGRPEIWVDEYFHSGTMMGLTTYLYHWQDGNQPDQGRFVEVTNGQIRSGLDQRYLLTPGGENGQPGTFSVSNMHWCSCEKETYRWNGFDFVLWDLKLYFPMDIKQVFSEMLNRAMLVEQFDEIDMLLKQPIDASSLAEIGPSAPDYITFQRAVNAALADKPAEAQKTLQGLLAAPANPKSPFLSIVRAYQASYHQAIDEYRACQAALTAHDQALLPYKDGKEYVTAEKAAEAMGYKVDDGTQVCSLNAALHQLVKLLDGSHPDQIPAQLAQYGVNIAWKTSLDANGDGKTDWLLRLDQSDTSYAWLLLSGSKAPKLISIGSFYKVHAGVHFEVLHLPGSDRDAYLLMFGDELKIFRVYPGDAGTAVEPLDYSYSVTGYKGVSDSTTTDLLINRDPQQYDPQERKHWDASLARFITYNAQEQELFLQNHPTQVIRDIPALLQRLTLSKQEKHDPWLEPARLRYLLALAYELSGDSERAAQTYYDLWRAYPDQPYAILAREKLELVQP